MNEDFRSRINLIIAESGRMILGVSGTEKDEEDHAVFSYTIGNSLSNKPELIMFGAHPQDAAKLFNHMSENYELVPGLLDLGGKFPVKLLRAGEKCRQEYSIQAGQYLGNETYPILQVLAPDTKGRWPGDPDLEPGYAQPILGVN